MKKNGESKCTSQGDCIWGRASVTSFRQNNAILEFMNIRETGKSTGEAGVVYFSKRVPGGFVFFLFYF